MKHVAGWESDGRLLELVGDKGKQQETVGRFMSLSVSKPTISICFICIVLWSTDGDWCRLMLTGVCALYHMNINWNQLNQQQTRTR